MNATQRRSQRLALGAVLALLPASLLAIGSVHEPVRLALGLAMLALGALAVRTRQRVAPELAWLGALAVGVVVLDALAHGLPVGSGVRAALQPGIATVVDRGLAVSGGERHGLALVPREHAVGQVFSLGLVSLVLATAALVDRSARAFQLAMVLVMTGVGVAVLGLFQAAVGAEGIYGITDFGRGQRFFGPLVNANHAGALFAALLPWSVALVRLSGRGAPLVVLAPVLLSLGLWGTGSRGAVVVAVLGLVVVLSLDREPRVRWVGWAAGGLGALLVLVVGPVALFEWFTAVIEPNRHHSHTLDSGRMELYRDVVVLASGVLGGVGLGGFEEAFHVVKDSPGFSTASQAHNDWLQTWIERGPLGVAGLGIAMWTVWAGLRTWMGAKPERQTLLGAAVASAVVLWSFALFDFPLRIGALAVLGALAHGTLLGMWGAGRDRGGPRALLAVTLVALGAGAVGTLFVVARVPVAARVAQADAAHAAGQLDSADVLLRAVLAEQPLHQPAVMRLAAVRIDAKDPEGARELLALAGDQWPSHPLSWLTLARLETRAGDRAAAAGAWRRVLALDLPEERRNALLSEAMALHGDPMASALAVLPDRPDRWCQAAGVRAVAGDVSAADALFREGVALDPGCKLFYAHWLARTYRAEEALPLVADAPDTCDGQRVKGRVMLGVGRTEEAVALFERSLASCATDDVWIRFMLARARVDLGEEDALDTMARIAEKHPHAGRSRLVYRYMDAAGRQPEALRWLGRVVASGEATDAEKARFERLGRSPGR